MYSTKRGVFCFALRRIHKDVYVYTRVLCNIRDTTHKYCEIREPCAHLYTSY